MNIYSQDKNSESQQTLLQMHRVGIKKNEKYLVRDISLEIKKGQIITLIGPNGSGKTTTAKMAAGIDKPTEGDIQQFADHIGYVPQKLDLDWTLPLRVIELMTLTSVIDDDTVQRALQLTKTEHLKLKNVSELSGGEFQRVLIARAIAKDPDLLILDEPVQGVDFKGEVEMYELIKLIAKNKNCGILLISHDLHVVMSATHHVICLNGHVCCEGSPKKIVHDEKYKELFGDRASNLMSIYHHDHNHTHALDGTIKKK
jgi:zinc transport system ATP-binding protein